MKGAKVWSIFKESDEKPVCLLSHVCSCCRRLARIGSGAVHVWQPARGLIWSTTRWPGSLVFSGFQCVSQPAALGLCLGTLCSLNSTVFKQFSSSRQDRSVQPRPWLQSFPLFLFRLVLVQTYLACLEGNRRGRGQVFPAFFLPRFTMADHSDCAQAAFWCSQNYGEKRSSCSTVNSRTLTSTLYAIQVEKPCLCHEECSLSFLTWGFLLSAVSFAHPIMCRFPRVDPDWHFHLQISSLPGLWCCAQEREILGSG